MRTLTKLSNDEGEVQGTGDRPTVLVTSPIGWSLGAWLPVTPAQRNVFSLLLFLVSGLAFSKPLEALWLFALHEESFSHVVLIPLVAGYLLVVKRASILTSKEWSPVFGMMLLLIGLLFYWSSDWPAAVQDWTADRMAAAIAPLVVIWWGIFLLSVGWSCFRQNLFALAFLLLMVPFPSVLLSAVVGFLQRSSAETAATLFTILDIPVFRQDLIFTLSHLTIHVAEECSGIRSFLSLLIVSLLAGHWFLWNGWAKVTLAACVVPLAVVKNAFRIVGLALLGNYVDQAYITNSLLHRAGGIPLFAVSLFVLAGLVWALRRFEPRLG
jgi:exosortase